MDAVLKVYAIFVRLYGEKKLIWIDPSTTPKWREVLPYKKYVHSIIIYMSLNYLAAMRV